MFYSSKTTLRGFTEMKELEFDPAKDGVTHIRIHRTAKSRLGRYLATCALTPFALTGRGRFASLDALRIYFAANDSSREVRELALERAEREVYYTSPEVLAGADQMVALVQGLESKLDQTMVDGVSLRQLFDNTNLPFVCYTMLDGEAVEEELPACIDHYLRSQRSPHYVRNHMTARKRASAKAPARTSCRSKPATTALAR